MPASVWCCYTGSAGHDLSAGLGFCLSMCDRQLLIVSVHELFVIGIEASLPARLSCLLGVPHLFVHFGMA